VGAHPIEAVQVMSRIIEATESGALESMSDRRAPVGDHEAEAIAESAVRAAQELQAAAVAVFTQTGVAVRLVAKYRPVRRSSRHDGARVRSQLTLVWGAETFIVPAVGHRRMVRQVERALLDLGRAKEGDQVVIVAGTPPGRRGTTNMLEDPPARGPS